MEILPFLSFPSVVTDMTLGKLTPYDLFSFSLHSEEARNILKRFSNRRKFHMSISLNADRLTFNYENEKENDLVLIAYPHNKPTDHILKFDGLSVFAEIETDEEGTLVCVYFKEKNRGERLQFLIEYMTSVFNNISISIDFGVMGRGKAYRIKNWTEGLSEKMQREQSRLVKTIKDTIKNLKLSIRSYNDKNDVHTFKQLNELISCEKLDVWKCEVTKEDLKKLFDKWMELENPGKIALGKIENFKIEDLSAGNVIESEEINSGTISHYFDVTRADGIKARIELWGRQLSFKVI